MWILQNFCCNLCIYEWQKTNPGNFTSHPIDIIDHGIVEDSVAELEASNEPMAKHCNIGALWEETFASQGIQGKWARSTKEEIAYILHIPPITDITISRIWIMQEIWKAGDTSQGIKYRKIFEVMLPSVPKFSIQTPVILAKSNRKFPNIQFFSKFS